MPRFKGWGPSHPRPRAGRVRRIALSEPIGLTLSCACGHTARLEVSAPVYYRLGFHDRLKCSQCGAPHKLARHNLSL